MLHIRDYQNFLYLIGSVFVPLSAVFIVEYFLLGGRRNWNTSESAPSRWWMLLPWAAGFVAYQLINPGGSRAGHQAGPGSRAGCTSCRKAG